MDFSSEYRIDYKSYCWVCDHVEPKQLGKALFVSGLYLLGLLILLFTGTAWGVIAGSVSYLVMTTVSLSKRRKAFREVQERNRGNLPHMAASADNTGVRCRNYNTEKDFSLSHDEIKTIKHDARFVHALNAGNTLALSFDLTTMTEDEGKALLKHLSGNGRNVLKLRSIRFVRNLSLGLTIFALLVSLFFGIRIEEYTALPNYEVPPMDVRTAATVLEELGIGGITEELIEEIESHPYGSEYGITTLLSYVGWGTYDEETWEWTPAETGVYALDLEAFDVSRMYSDILRGICALSGGELAFKNVTEDMGQLAMRLGIGWKKVVFTLDGKRHTLRPFTIYDWTDADFLDDVAKIVERSDRNKQIYFLYEPDTVVYLFYCDETWAAEFEAKTGYVLEKRSD